MTGTKESDSKVLDVRSRAILANRGVVGLAHIQKDQIPDQLSEPYMKMLNRTDRKEGDAGQFGLGMAHSVIVHLGALPAPKRVMLMIEEDANQKTVNFFAAVLYGQEDFNTVLSYYEFSSGNEKGQGLKTVDLKEEKPAPGNAPLYALVIGPYKLASDAYRDSMAVEEDKMLAIRRFREEFGLSSKAQVEIPSPATEPRAEHPN